MSLIVGGKGRGQLQFHRPVGVAVSHVTGHIVVFDSNCHRLQVLASSGGHVRALGPQWTPAGSGGHQVKLKDHGCIFINSMGM